MRRIIKNIKMLLILIKRIYNKYIKNNTNLKNQINKQNLKMIKIRSLKVIE